MNAWLSWWRSGFVHQIDRSWHHLTFFELSDTAKKQITEKHPLALLPLLSLSPLPVQPPDKRVLKWVELSQGEETGVMALTRAICFQNARTLTEPDNLWCERIAKALRPETWLPSHWKGQPDELIALLLPLMSVGSWSRMRLRFHYSDVLKAEDSGDLPLPINRISALWDAVLYRIRET